MSYSGQIIRTERRKLSISQKQLAEGICSTSYLSKIENGQAVFNDDIIKMLFERLEIKYEPQKLNLKEQNNILLKYHEQIYQEKNPLILKSIIKSIKVKISQLSYIDMDIGVSIRLFELRLFCLNRQYSDAKKVLEELHPKLKKANLLNNIIFLVYSAQYYLLNHSSKLAFYNMEKVLSIINNSTPNWLKGYTYYLTALSYNNLNDYPKALYYAQKAIYYFEESFQYNRCIECYILIGISYIRLKDYENAEKNLYKSEHLNHQIGNKKLLSNIWHNLAVLFQKKYQFDYSIKIFYKTLSLKHTEKLESVMNTSIQLAKVYYKNKEYTKCKTILNNQKFTDIYIEEKRLLYNLILIKENNDKNLLPIIEKSHKKIEALSSREVISDYSYFLAEVFSYYNQYKKSSLFYKKALISTINCKKYNNDHVIVEEDFPSSD